LFENQILISSAAAEQVIQKMNFERTGHQREILFFRVIFVIILLATILIVTAMIVMIRQKRSLMAAYKNLALRIRQSLHAEREPTPEIIIQVSDKKSGIILKLQEIITSQKIYLNKDLTLTELSAILQTNKSYLSEVINTKFGMNFNDYMNQLRIKEACRLMLEPGFAKSSLDQIADKCGFNSKSTFYVAFKKSTGMSPAAFSKTLSDKKPAEPMNYIALASTGDQPVKVAIKKGDFSVADPDTSKNPPEI
jgi:YesN/AraC family two-component response regulator